MPTLPEREGKRTSNSGWKPLIPFCVIVGVILPVWLVVLLPMAIVWNLGAKLILQYRGAGARRQISGLPHSCCPNSRVTTFFFALHLRTAYHHLSLASSPLLSHPPLSPSPITSHTAPPFTSATVSLSDHISHRPSSHRSLLLRSCLLPPIGSRLRLWHSPIRCHSVPPIDYPETGSWCINSHRRHFRTAIERA